MRRILHRFFAIVLLAGSILLGADFVQACSCATSSLDWEVSNSANIVILKLQSVEKYKNDDEGYGTDGIKQSKLIVQKVFKGKLKIGQAMTFEQGGGADCIWAFSEKRIGTNYLFFLNKNDFSDGLWQGSVCSRSSSVTSSAADLLYLKKLNQVREKTRLSGKVTKIIYPLDFSPVRKNLNGIVIRIVGNGKEVAVKTNKDGIYEVYGLPIGEYKLIIPKIEGYRVYTENDSLKIEIKAKGFVEKDIEYLVD